MTTELASALGEIGKYGHGYLELNGIGSLMAEEAENLTAGSAVRNREQKVSLRGLKEIPDKGLIFLLDSSRIEISDSKINKKGVVDYGKDR